MIDFNEFMKWLIKNKPEVKLLAHQKVAAKALCGIDLLSMPRSSGKSFLIDIFSEFINQRNGISSPDTQEDRYFLITFTYSDQHGSGDGYISMKAERFPSYREIRTGALEVIKHDDQELMVIVPVSIYEFKSKQDHEDFTRE